MIVFVVAALWFAVITVRNGEHRAANGYHTLMMLAMAWMYAAMGGLPLQTAERSMTAQSTMAGMPGMPGMPGMESSAGHAGHGSHSAVTDSTGDAAGWIGVVNWACAVGFGIAAVFWLYRYVTTRVRGNDRAPGQGVGVLCQFAMAAGMAVMFAVML